MRTQKGSKSVGGNGLAQELAKLAVPFGLVLAQNSLKNYLKAKSTKTNNEHKSAIKPSAKKQSAKKPSAKKVTNNRRVTIGGHTPGSKIEHPHPHP
jgi:hypothetical protein